MRYQFELESPASEQVLAAFPEFIAVESGPDHWESIFVGDVVDQSHLHSVIARIETLGLGLAGVHRLPD